MRIGEYQLSPSDESHTICRGCRWIDDRWASLTSHFRAAWPAGLALLALCGSASSLAQGLPGAACGPSDMACSKLENERSPVRTKAFWASVFSKPIEQRVFSAPVELVNSLTLQNQLDGFADRPQSVTLSADFKQDVVQALADIPASIRQRLAPKLAGIYFVKGLGSTGLTDYARGRWFEGDAGFVVLDVDVLSKLTANAWATWKENTPFKPDGRFRLEARIEDDSQDNRKNAIRYILLHELGHVLSIGEKIHPPWDTNPRDLKGYAFTQLSWQIAPPKYEYKTIYDDKFLLRKEVVYYLGAALPASQMKQTYEQLQATNFPTLYAATRPGDDFAESFVSYVHTVLLNRPSTITLYDGDKAVQVVGSCWDSARCAAKRAMLERLLK